MRGNTTTTSNIDVCEADIPQFHTYKRIKRYYGSFLKNYNISAVKVDSTTGFAVVPLVICTSSMLFIRVKT